MVGLLIYGFVLGLNVFFTVWGYQNNKPLWFMNLFAVVFMLAAFAYTESSRRRY